jgi:hypothetical protein
MGLGNLNWILLGLFPIFRIGTRKRIFRFWSKTAQNSFGHPLEPRLSTKTVLVATLKHGSLTGDLFIL